MNSNKKYILVVEDDASLASWITDYLISQNFEVCISDRGDLAIEMIRSESPDLVLLDINLPVKDGFDICREVRQFYQNPILMMTARDDELDEVLGLELGADDYITKPIRARTLLARIKNLLRRTESDLNSNDCKTLLKFGQFSINAKSRCVKVESEVIDISSNEFDVLWILTSHAGEIVSRDSLTKQLRGFEYDGFDRSSDILVSRLRKKLGTDSSDQQRIKTIWGKGYLFSPEQW
jgi:DNA-binding response OmpR family regulator